MRDNISPEEKLLRLIRGTKKKEAEIKPEATSPNDAPQNTPIANTKAQKKIRLPDFKISQAWKDLFTIQRIIPILFIVALVYLLAAFIYPYVGLKKIDLPRIEKKQTLDDNLTVQNEIKPFEDYQKDLKNRPIFSNTGSPDSPANPMGLPGSAAADLIKDINLVGVITGDNPQAIIEDKKSQKTYYVTKGQTIGQFEIESIEEGKIILNYDGQRFELHL